MLSVKWSCTRKPDSAFGFFVKVLQKQWRKRRFPWKPTARRHLLREQRNKRTLFFPGRILPTWPCTYPWLSPRSLTQLPLYMQSAFILAAQKWTTITPQKKNAGLRKIPRTKNYFSRRVAVCRGNDSEKPPCRCIM